MENAIRQSREDASLRQGGLDNPDVCHSIHRTSSCIILTTRIPGTTLYCRCHYGFFPCETIMAHVAIHDFHRLGSNRSNIYSILIIRHSYDFEVYLSFPICYFRCSSGKRWRCNGFGNNMGKTHSYYCRVPDINSAYSIISRPIFLVSSSINNQHHNHGYLLFCYGRVQQ